MDFEKQASIPGLSQFDTVRQSFASGTADRSALLQALLIANLIVPSKVPAGDSLHLVRPLLLDSKQGKNFLAVFTRDSGAEAFRFLAPYRVRATGREIVAEVPESMGLVVDPDTVDVVELSVDEVTGLR